MGAASRAAEEETVVNLVEKASAGSFSHNDDEEEETSAHFRSEPEAFSNTIDDFTTSTNSSSFHVLLRKQVHRVVGFVVTEQINHEMFAKNLLREVVRARSMDNDNEKDEQQIATVLLQKVSSLTDSYKSLEQYATNMTNALAKMAERASPADQKELRAASFASLQREMEGSNKSSAFIVVLNDIYEIIRAAKAAEAIASKKQMRVETTNSTKKWVAPATFERKTTKYWVELGRMTEVLLAAVREAPLLVYGASGRLTSDQDLNRSEGDKLWNSLASSNNSVYFESKTMSLYKERILRRERSQLFRIRWYGDHKPKGDEIVFLELKMHHEKWVNESSVKQRVNIHEKDVKALLSSTNLCIQDAERMICSASPKLKGKDLEKAIALLLTMHRLVVENNLHPCIRTRYQRVAFQSSESNNLRLTVDRNIILIDESSTPPGAWCLPDDAIQDNIIKRVPFDVLEIKLTDGTEMPSSMESLVRDGVIVEATKFSKFLTGAAAFNTTKVNLLPYWAEHKAFAPLFAITDCSNTKSQGIGSDFTRLNPAAGGTIKHDDTDSTEHRPVNVAKSDTARSMNPEKTGGHASFGKVANLLMLGKMRRRQGNRENQPSLAPRRPVRVEPKSYFANERTYIQWVSGAILLFTIALIMLEYGTPQFSGVGLALLGSATVIVAYSMFVYIRRVKLLSRGEPYGYVDHCGPTFLGCAVFLGLVAIIVIFMTIKLEEYKQARYASFRIQPKPNVCVQLEVAGLSRLEYQPSDILVLENDDRLMIASLETILVDHPMGLTETLVTIPGADLEGLTSVGQQIFALSEVSKKKSELIELKWDFSMNQLEYIQRWEIPTPNAEGIAFVPGNPTGKLYISGDLVEEVGESVADRGIIDVYEIPSNTTASPLTGHRLNSHLINEGLEDSKISALQYFEGVLYVLHDNDKVVRAWELNDGKLLSEWKLPPFSKQWEGMALQRRPPKNGQQLRGSSSNNSGNLLLHLALDSPPQVWTLAVGEGEERGEIILPDCAMV